MYALPVFTISRVCFPPSRLLSSLSLILYVCFFCEPGCLNFFQHLCVDGVVFRVRITWLFVSNRFHLRFKPSSIETRKGSSISCFQLWKLSLQLISFKLLLRFMFLYFFFHNYRQISITVIVDSHPGKIRFVLCFWWKHVMMKSIIFITFLFTCLNFDLMI
jgi:hypothetical protein